MTGDRTPVDGALDHVGIVVSDRDSAVDWYVSALDLRPVWWEAPVDVDPVAIGLPGKAVRLRGAVLDAGPNLFLELHEFLSGMGDRPRRPWDLGYSHLAWTPPDVGEAYERLAAHGVDWWGEPRVIESGGLAGQVWVWGRTPDVAGGAVIELHTYPGDPVPDRPLLSHPGITVSDLHAAETWYRQHFGWRTRWREAWTTVAGDFLGVPAVPVSLRGVTMDTGSCYVELHEFGPPPGMGRKVDDLGIGHMSIWCDDSEATAARMTAAGVRFHAPVRRITTGGLAGHDWAYWRDVDNNVGQLCNHPAPPTA